MAALARSFRGCFVPASDLPDMRQVFGGLTLERTGIIDSVGGTGRSQGSKGEQVVHHRSHSHWKRRRCLAGLRW